MNKPIALELAQITKDGGTQSRAELNKATIKEYCEIYKNQDDFLNNSEELPPITVFYDGMKYWLADGFHREAAANEAMKTTIMANVIQGTQRDAILFSVGANATHGLPRTQEDKYRAVKTILNDSEWKQWSDREIARVCKVSHPFVSKIRKEDNEHTGNVTSKTYKRGDKVQTMKTKNIGKKAMPDAEQFKEAVKQELENTHPKLAEQFDQNVKMQPYNAISEKGKILDLRNREDVIEILAESELRNTKEKLAQVEKEVEKLKSENGLLKEEAKLSFKEQVEFEEKKLEHFNTELQLFTATRQIAEIIGFNQDGSNLKAITWENVLEKLKEIIALNNKVSTITETNNQLFVDNENLTKKLNEIKQKNVDLETKLKETTYQKNREIEILNEAKSYLREEINEGIERSMRMSTCLIDIDVELESYLEAGIKKKEGIRINRTDSKKLLDKIKQGYSWNQTEQAKGVE